MFAEEGQKPSPGRLPCVSGWIQGSGLCMSGSQQENGCIALRGTLASGGSDVYMGRRSHGFQSAQTRKGLENGIQRPDAGLWRLK